MRTPRTKPQRRVERPEGVPATRPSATIDADGRKMSKKPNNDKPVKNFVESIDREALDMYLGEHDKYQTFLAALHDPVNARTSFAHTMRTHGITLHELNVLYQDGQRNKGLFAMSSKLPQIMEDVSVDALSKEVACQRCDGKGDLEDPSFEDGLRPCPDCDATGKTRQIGDKHSRDLVFESMKLTNQKGPLVAFQNNTYMNNNGMDAKMEDMLRLTQSITMGDRKAE